jgi:membrane-associated phospholipid phosphatase
MTPARIPSFRMKAAALGACLLAAFALYSQAVKRGAGKQADFDTTVRIQDKLTHEGRVDTDTVMEGATFFVSPGVSLFWIGCLTIAAAIDIKRKRIRWTAVVLPVVFGFMVFGELYGKAVVHHPSPPFFMIKNPTTKFPRYYVNEQYSYPSGHAARAVFLAVATGSLLWPWLVGRNRKLAMGLMAAGFIALVGVSRIYLGHHWLSDIVGGTLLGAGSVGFWLALL